MKRVLLFGSGSGGPPPIDNTFTFLVDATSNSFTIPTDGTATYDYNVSWSDGSLSNQTGNAVLTWPSGTANETIVISGNRFDKMYFNNGGDKLKLKEVTNWGFYSEQNTNQIDAFHGCQNFIFGENTDYQVWNTIILGQRCFNNCKAIGILPEGLTFNSLTQGFSMFRLCNNIQLSSTIEFAVLEGARQLFEEAGLTDLPTPIKFSAITTGLSCFLGNNINPARYSQLLVDLENLNPNNSIDFHGGDSQYNDTGEIARDILTAVPRSWTITDGGKIIDLYLLIGGQSNAVGTTSGADPTRSELLDPITNCIIDKNGTFETLDYPLNNQGNEFGPELSFGYNYTINTGAIMHMAKRAYSGSAVGIDISRDDFNVASLQDIVDLKDGLTKLKDKAILDGAANPKFVMVWIQGERDARLAFGADYQLNFNDILDELNIIETLDYVVLNLLNEGIVNASIYYEEVNITAVRNAQIALGAEHTYIDTIDMNNYTLGADDLHFTAEAQQLLGDALFNLVKAKYNF